jgi:hypothetical protein
MSLARHLPSGFGLRRATAADALHVGPLMRSADRAEIEALEGRPVGAFLGDMIVGGARGLTVRGEPMVLYGIVASEELPHHAMPWLVTTSTLVHDELMSIMWMSRMQVDFWQRRWPVLQALCDSRNDFRREWLEWLGFVRCGHLAAFGAARLPFDLYARSRYPETAKVPLMRATMPSAPT